MLSTAKNQWSTYDVLSLGRKMRAYRPEMFSLRYLESRITEPNHGRHALAEQVDHERYEYLEFLDVVEWFA